MSEIVNIETMHPGAKYRPCPWFDLYQEGAPCIGWGISQKKVGERVYTPVAWRGNAHPFEVKADAQKLCRELNATPIAPDARKD